MESHLRSAMRIHLDLACVKLRDTEDKLNETELKLTETENKLNDTEQTTKNQMNELENFQRRFQEKVINDHKFVWKIDNFSKILREAKAGENETIFSSPFYTESHGYKLKVQIFPNESDTHLAVFLVLVKGEYDAILPWPLRKKVKFTLIDQQENPDERIDVTNEYNTSEVYRREPFIRPVAEQNEEFGFPRFVSHRILLTRRYIVDDTLFLRIEVGPTLK